MTALRKVLICGAGPTGLSAAIECARRGLSVQIVDRAPGPTERSRALAFNRASLELMEASGVSAQIMARSHPFQQASFHYEGRLLAAIALPQPKAGYEAIRLISQPETERVMEQVLAGLGVNVQWNTEIVAATQDETGISLTLTNGDTLRGDTLLGADGARSLVRKQIGLTLEGSDYPETWSLMDARLDRHHTTSQATIYTHKTGVIFIAIQIEGDRYRCLANRPGIESLIGQHHTVIERLTHSEFDISLRRVKQFGKDRIWIAGDAAHVHTPVGGMGMNLGIADACDFAACAASDDPFTALAGGYNTRRIAAAKRVLALSDRGYQMASTTNPVMRRIRNLAVQMVAGFGPARWLLARQVFGSA